MIRFWGFRDGNKPVVGIGINKQDIANLVLGEVIQMQIGETEVLIFAGETDFKMTRDCQHMFSARTNIKIDPSAIIKP